MFFFEFFGVVHGEFEAAMVATHAGGPVPARIWNRSVREG